MSTPVLNNNGLFKRDVNVQISSSLDKFHLYKLIGESKPDDFGLLETWASMHKRENPIYAWGDFGKNVKEVEDLEGRFTYKQAIATDIARIVEDMDATNQRTGAGGRPFKIKTTKRFSHTEVLTYDKMNGLEFFVTEDPIVQSGDGYIHTCVLVEKNEGDWIPKQFLRADTPIFSVGTAKSGEYGEEYSDMFMDAAYREYTNYVGNAMANVKYHISSEVDLYLKSGVKNNGTVDIVQLWRCFDKSILEDPSIVSFDDLRRVKSDKWIKSASNNGDLTMGFLTKLEAAGVKSVLNSIEKYLMWGKGGILNTDGPDKLRLSMGLWRQLDNVNKKIYNFNNFSLDLFKWEIYNHYEGRVDFDALDADRTIEVQTGIGGMRLVNEAIMREATKYGLSIDAGTKAGIGAITGSGMGLGFGFAFDSITLPFLGQLKFVLNPAFDNVNSNDIENPYVKGHRLSSYSFIIRDITQGPKDNIQLLKSKYDNKFRWFYINGTMDYLGRTGHQAAHLGTGYKVYMMQKYPAVWVKDTSGFLKIVMRNPKTGGSL